MIGRSGRSWFTIVELVLVLIIVIFALVLVIPGIQSAREAGRRAQCLNNMMQIGLGFQNHESAVGTLPPSCQVTVDAEGNITSVEGWSWWVHLLPYIENMALWETLNSVDGLSAERRETPSWSGWQTPKVRSVEGSPLDGATGHAKALATSFLDLLCPSFSGTPYVDVRTKAEAITNYKAMGATHVESLNVASPNPTTPKYAPDSDRHPDGAIYPGSTHGVAAFKSDGTSRTVMVVESIEQNVARWTVGNECTVVGLPPVVTFWPYLPSPYPYFHPTGYQANRFWDQSAIPSGNNRTYLDWDYERNPYNDGGVSTPSAAASGPIRYGPSSDHVGVTNHACADGSVHSISNEIDAALYMFMITRNGEDPVPGFEAEP